MKRRTATFLVPAGFVLLCATWGPTFAASQTAPQQESFEARLARAIAALDSAEVETGVDLLRSLLGSPDPAAPRLAIARAHLHLAAASLSFGLRDSAVAHLREMVRANPFAVPDTLVFNPDVVSQFRRVRRTTPALDFRVAADTLLWPEKDRYLVAVAVGEPRQVNIALVGPGEGTSTTFEVRRLVDSSATVPLAAVGPDSLPLAPGIYRMMLNAGRDLQLTVSLRVGRVAALVDTMQHQPPPDSSLFRPETRKGPPVGWSAVAGLALGAVATAAPSLLSNRDIAAQGLDARAVSIGGTIAAAGIVGVFVGRRPVSIPENVEFNRRLVASWQERNAQIAAENERRRRWAPLRIEVVRQ